MNFSEFVSTIPLSHKTGDGWMTRCPAHADNKASLKVTEGAEGRIVFHCHAMCEPEAVAAGFGLEMKDLMGDADGGKPQARANVEYIYTDEHGAYRHKKIRQYNPKRFFQEAWDVGAGKWVKSMDGVQTVLYHLPEVMGAIEKRIPIFLVEGEKDVEAGRETSEFKEGKAVFTTAGAVANWQPRFAELLKKAAHVYVIADADEPGRKLAKTICEQIPGARPRLAAIGKDLADHLGAGKTLGELRKVTVEEMMAGPDVPDDLSGAPAETAVIGEALRSPLMTFRSTRGLLPEHFSDTHLGKVWAEIIDMRDRGEQIDIEAVDRRWVEKTRQSIHDHLSDLVRSTPRLSAYGAAKLIRAAWTQRTLAPFVGTASMMVGGKAADFTAEQLFEAMQNLPDVSKALGARLSTPQEALLDWLEELENGNAGEVVPSGVECIDGLIGGGLQEKKMYTIAAHSGVGKSAIALQVARAWAKKGNRVLFFTLEMTKEEQINRLVAMEGKYDISTIESARRQPEPVRDGIIGVAWQYYERFIHFHDRQVTFADIAALTAEARELGGRLLVVIDYLGLIRGGDNLKGADRLSKITEDLKDMSKAGNGCAVLLLAQLNRENELFGSDGAKRDADVVLFFRRDKPDVAKSTLTMRVEKVRNGPGTGEERFFASIDSDLLLKEITHQNRTSQQI